MEENHSENKKTKDEANGVTKNGHIDTHHKEELMEEVEYAQGDQVLEAIGDWGPWQRDNFVLLGLFVMPVAWPVLWMTFMNAKMDYWCARPPTHANMSVQLWKNVSGQTEDGCSLLDRD